MITLLGIPFDFMGMSYYRTDKDINVGDSVVVNKSSSKPITEPI